MSATQSWFGPSAVKSRSTRSGAGRASRIAARGDRPLAPAHARQARRAHQPGDALAADADALAAQLGVDARRAVGPARARVDRADRARSAPRPRARAPTPAACATRSTRWGRHPARGTSWRSRCAAWCALTNSNPSAGSSRSPERTRPRLFSGSPAPRAASCSRGAAGAAPRAPRSSARRARRPSSRSACATQLRIDCAGRLELLGQLLRRAPGTHQLDQPPPELRRVRRS